MILATRCPYCRTMFRVVQDQLKICNGIVRCGTCRQVFNGIEQLQSADAATKAMQAQQAEQQSAWPESAQAHPNPVTIMADNGPKGRGSETVDDLNLILTPAEEPPPRPTRLTETPEPFFDAPEPSEREPVMEEPSLHLDLHYGSRQEPSLADEIRADDRRERDFTEDMTFPRTQLPVVEPTLSTPMIEAEEDDPAYKVDIRPQKAEPAFVQRAKRQERYGRFGRLATWLLVLALLPALFLQMVDAFHLRIGAILPSTKPMLAQICDVIGCQADLPAQIDSVSIDSYELHSPTKGETAFTLTVLLRNRSKLTQAWPALELTLKDAEEKPIVRRVFHAKEYLVDKEAVPQGFAANTEYSVKLQFEVEPPLKPVGYEVYLFYS